MPANLLIQPGAAVPDRREAETLLAAVLTLMTDHALTCCDGHRAAVAQRIAACFLALSLSSGVNAGSKSLALRLHARWLPPARDALASQQAGVPGGADNPHLTAPQARGEPPHQNDHKVLWHTTPEFIQ